MSNYKKKNLIDKMNFLTILTLDNMADGQYQNVIIEPFG